MKFVNLQWPSTQSKPSFAWNCRLLNTRVMSVGSVEACWNFTSSLIRFFLGKSLYCEDCYKILLNLEMSSFGQIQRMNRGMLPTQLAETGAKPANYPWKESWKKSWKVWCLCMLQFVQTLMAPSFSTATKASSARMRQRFGFKLLVWFSNFLRGGFDLGPSSILHIDPGFINPKAVSLGSCVSNSRFSGIAPQLNRLGFIYYSSRLDMSMNPAARWLTVDIARWLSSQSFPLRELIATFLRFVTVFLRFSFVQQQLILIGNQSTQDPFREVNLKMI